MKNIFVITHSDLDGVVSYLTVKWAFPKDNIEYHRVFNASDFRSDFTSWLSTNSCDKYDQIFILDLDVSDSYDLLNHKNVFVIDHHETHLNNIPTNSKATIAVKKYTSCALLTSKIFEKIYKTKFTKGQKSLIELADDYDSYTFAMQPLSQQLNIIYWQTDRSFDSFIKNFHNGFNGFNFHQKNIIDQYEKKLNTLIDSLILYKGKVSINNESFNIVATFANKMINDICDYLIRDQNADVAITVNILSEKVSFRKKKTIGEELNLGLLAEKLCEGGGHSYAAGGKLTPQFMEFTKKLTPCK